MNRFFVLPHLWSAIAIFALISSRSAFASDDLFAANLRELPGLAAIEVGEMSGVLKISSFDISDPRLSSRLPTISEVSNDFQGAGAEYFDVYFSNRDGTPAQTGNVLTIDATFQSQNGDSGGNIAFAGLRFSDGSTLLADRLISVQVCPGGDAASGGKAVDDDMTSYSSLGNCADDGKIRLSIGFSEKAVKSAIGRLHHSTPAGDGQKGGIVFRPSEDPRFQLSETAQVPENQDWSALVPLMLPERRGALLIAESRSESSMWFIDARSHKAQLVRRGGALTRLSNKDGDPRFASQDGSIYRVAEQADTSIALQVVERLTATGFQPVATGSWGNGAKPVVALVDQINGSLRLAPLSPSASTADALSFSDSALKEKLVLVRAVDLNRDGDDDLVLVTDSGAVGTMLAFPELHRLVGTGFLAAIGKGKRILNAQLGTTVADGSEELLLSVDDGSAVRVILRNGTIASAEAADWQLSYSGSGFKSAGDYDGDGRLDAFVFPPQSRDFVALLTSGGFFRAKASRLELLARDADKLIIASADVTDDGLDDLLLFDKRTQKLWLAQSAMSAPVAHYGFNIRGIGSVKTDALGRFEVHPESIHDSALDVTAGELITPNKLLLGAAEGMRKFLLLPFSVNRPRVCLGYLPGMFEQWGQTFRACPRGYAWLSVDDPSSDLTDVSRIPVEGTCCPLPADDILLDEHFFVDEQCPPDTIVTGGQGTVQPTAKRFALRCTKLNTKRYRLSEKTPGKYWGIGYSLDENGERVDRSLIPAALRSGVGRVSRAKWDFDGCVGRPWGSVLVGGKGPSCSKFQFSQLQYSGAAGDPPTGEPVQMFPSCETVDDVFDPLSGCRSATPGTSVDRK